MRHNENLHCVLPFLCDCKSSQRNPQWQEADQQLSGVRAEEGRRKYLGVPEKFCILSVLAVTRVCTFLKTHKIIHLIWVYFIVYKLQLNTGFVFVF